LTKQCRSAVQCHVPHGRNSALLLNGQYKQRPKGAFPYTIWMIICLLGLSGSGDCKALLEVFHETCQYLGVPIAHEKTEGPVTEIVFLCLQINTQKQTVTIPMDKLEEIVQKIK
jgi:hypothetical protein